MLHQTHTEVRDWGTLGYEESCLGQERIFTDRVAGRGPDVVVAVRHPPTITLGRHAPAEDVVADSEVLRACGIAVSRSDRGGRATYHDEGQAVVYPIVGIADLGLGVRAWVGILEETIQAVLSGYGIAARCRGGTPGLWTDQGKIASIGLRIRHGVSTHGLSVNVNLDVGAFNYIVACGAAGQPVTTLALESGDDVQVSEVSDRLCLELKRRIDERRRA